MTSAEAITVLLGLFSRFRSKPVWISRAELMLDLARDEVDFATIRSLSDADFVSSFADARVQSLYDSGQPGTLPINGSLRLQVPRRWDKLVIAENFDDLLSLSPAREVTPAAYVVVEVEGVSSPVTFNRGDSIDSLPSPLDLYHYVLALWEMVKSFADHTDESGSILFFGIRRIQLRPGFDREDLVRPHWTPPILAFMANSDRGETRREILLAVLSDMLRDQKPEQSFRYLLANTQVLSRQLTEGMSIYLSVHSPEKLAGEARASALAFSETLEKIIGGLEAKGLTVPAAILLAVKDVQAGAGLSSVNLMILLSLLTFAITMWFIHQSQHDLISQLRQTIGVAKEELKRKGLAGDNPVLKDKFDRLEKRADRALIASSAIRWASVAPLISVSCFAFFGHVPPTPPLK